MLKLISLSIFPIFCLAREEQVLEEVKIALVGKYTKLEDAYLSVIKALKHAALHCNRKLCILVRTS